MSHTNMHDHDALPGGARVAALYFCGFLLIAGFYLFTEHTAHVFGVLPYLPILACPLMHPFMHHGHGGHCMAQSPPASGGTQFGRCVIDP